MQMAQAEFCDTDVTGRQNVEYRQCICGSDMVQRIVTVSVRNIIRKVVVDVLKIQIMTKAPGVLEVKHALVDRNYMATRNFTYLT